MLRSHAFFVSLLASALLAPAAEINVDNFKQPGATGAVLAGSSWVNNVTRTPETIVVGGNARDDNGWGAIGQSINAEALNYVTIYAQLNSGNSAPSFVLQLEDEPTLKTHRVSVSTSSFRVGEITAVQVPLGPWPAGFNRARIGGWNIGGGTTGVVPLRMTFDHLVLSSNATLSAPTITVQPADRVAGVGTGTTLTVAATGTPTLRYQWKRGTPAVPISGATNATLEFTNLAVAASDTYQVDVINDAGTTPSRVATLTVLDLTATHALATVSAGGYVPGATVTVTNTVTYAGTAPTSLGWVVVLPTGWSYASDAGNAPQTKPAVNATGLAEWTWTSVPASPATFTYTLNVPGTATGAQAITAQLGIAQNAVNGTILVKNDPLIVPVALRPHSADTTGDYAFDVVELTRVIQLYNVRVGTTRTGAYKVATTTTEDGFDTDAARASGATVALARYHAADVNRDASLSLVELTRVIELYNYRVGTTRTGQYHVQADTEDGFAPGP